VANENFSEEEYLDSLLAKVNGGEESQVEKEKSIKVMSDAEMEEEAERKVQEMMREGLDGMKPPSYRDISMDQLIENEQAGEDVLGNQGVFDHLPPEDKDLLDSLDSIVQEIKGETLEESEETKPEKQKKTKTKKSKKKDGSFSEKLKNVFFKVEVVDPVEEEEKEKKKKEEKAQKKAREAEEKQKAKAQKAEDKKVSDAAKKEAAQKRKEEQARIREEKKAKKAELAAARGPEERVKLKPAFVIFLITVIAVLTISVTMLSNVYAYNFALDTAHKNFVNHKYKEAYECLAGVKIKEEDQMFYDQVRMVVRLDRQYDAYVNYRSLGMAKEALHALLQGMTIYYDSLEYAEAYNLGEQFQTQKETLLYSLSTDFGIDEERARQICALENTNDYTREVELYSANYLQ